MAYKPLYLSSEWALTSDHHLLGQEPQSQSQNLQCRRCFRRCRPERPRRRRRRHQPMALLSVGVVGP